jgi:hypothetical protein
MLLVLFALLAAGTAQAQERDRSTGEIVALGLNGYLVFLEISEIGDSRPSRWLGRIGAATGIVTLGLKSYDGGLFSGLLTTAAIADTALGLSIVIRAERGGGRKLTLGPVVRPTPDGPAAGFALRFH